VQEFQDLARAYNVMSVPKTVINYRVQFVGAVTEEVMMERILQAVGAAEADEEQAEQVSDQATIVR
jgi:predicted DsbA family dithiol-disulfide isomerase